MENEIKSPKKKNYDDLRKETFDEMKLTKGIEECLKKNGYEKPTEIQKIGIPVIKENENVIFQSQSGTGKTLTFCIGSLQINNLKNPGQILIIVPTVELAYQIQKVLTDLLNNKEVIICTCVGKTSLKKDINVINSGAQIIIGTPGRIYQLLHICINITNLKTLIMDEIDQLFDIDNLREKTEEILSIISHYENSEKGFNDKYKIQKIICSATIDDNLIEYLKKEWITDPYVIRLEDNEISLDGIDHYYINCEENWKIDIIKDLYEQMENKRTIIFCNSIKNIEKLNEALNGENHTMHSIIHGRMNIDQRNDIMEKFKIGEFKILISTDMLSRGIDISGVYLIVNYDIPSNTATYIHRIGRTGRFGRKGLAINLVCTKYQKDPKKIIEIENRYQMNKMKEMPDNLF